jgi:hypothetical protein
MSPYNKGFWAAARFGVLGFGLYANKNSRTAACMENGDRRRRGRRNIMSLNQVSKQALEQELFFYGKFF